MKIFIPTQGVKFRFKVNSNKNNNLTNDSILDLFLDFIFG